MTPPQETTIIAAGILVVATTAFFAGRSHTRRSAKRREVSTSNEVVAEFGSVPIESRGWIGYSLVTEPHTEIFSRFPPPRGCEYTRKPQIFGDASQICALAHVDPQLWQLRFLLQDGSVRAVDVRKSGVALLTPEATLIAVARIITADFGKREGLLSESKGALC